jgi:hypothetical protein
MMPFIIIRSPTKTAVPFAKEMRFLTSQETQRPAQYPAGTPHSKQLGGFGTTNNSMWL